MSESKVPEVDRSDPNECPCTTGRDSFDGMTLLELGAQKPDPHFEEHEEDA